jgi:hypothetical protein
MDYSKYDGHTKSCWLTKPDSPADIVCETAEDDDTIATVWHDTGEEEYEVNIRLITDAPKLLARCKELENIANIREHFHKLATAMKINGQAGGVHTQVMWADAFLEILGIDHVDQATIDSVTSEHAVIAEKEVPASDRPTLKQIANKLEKEYAVFAIDWLSGGPRIHEEKLETSAARNFLYHGYRIFGYTNYPTWQEGDWYSPYACNYSENLSYAIGRKEV